MSKKWLLIVLTLFSVGFSGAIFAADGKESVQVQSLKAQVDALNNIVEQQVKEIKRLKEDIIKLENENRKLKALLPEFVPPAKPQATPQTPPGSTGKSDKNLATIEAMCDAISKANAAALDDPRKKPQWNRMTTLQREKATAAFERRKKDLIKNSPVNFRGKKITWTLQVVDVQKDKTSGKYLLILRSKEGYLATAIFNKTRYSEIASLKRDQVLTIGGTIKDYRVSSPSRPSDVSFFGVSPKRRSSFGVLLENPRILEIHQTVTFFGLTQTADNVIFLIDRSGSMVQTFGGVREEALRSINNLGPKINFQIITFAEGAPRQLEGKDLLKATPENKAKAKAFLDKTTPEGRTDVMPALSSAFALLSKSRKEKNVIFLLTDGDFRGKEPRVLAYLKRVNNKAKKATISTFLYGNIGHHAAQKILKQIAEENGGAYKPVPFEE